MTEVIHQSAACKGERLGWSCADCDDADCEHECHFAEQRGGEDRAPYVWAGRAATRARQRYLAWRLRRVLLRAVKEALSDF